MSRKRLITPALALVLSSCSASRPEQINLVVETKPDRPGAIDELVTAVARAADMRVNKQELRFGEAAKASAFLLHNHGVSVSIRKALEDCPEPRASFDPCFSASDYNVSIYRSSLLPSRRPLKLLAEIFVRETKKLGGRAYLNPQAVNDA